MISRYAWFLREALKRIWIRVVAFALLAILSAGLARVVSPYLPAHVAFNIGSEAVAQLLSILTSSMLAVTTFSLSIAVSAFSDAASTATPRVTSLLQEDRITQTVLSTFLGAFLFGLIGLIALQAEFYDASGKVVVFFFTIGVIGLVVVALIRWIDHLMRFGRMGETLDRVEAAASEALTTRLRNPFLGAHPLTDALPADARAVTAEEAGYVQHVDMQALRACAEDAAVTLYLCQLPGSFVASGEPLLFANPDELTDGQVSALRDAVTVGTRRTFEEDPRFGLVVLAEIASRALSPAVNDPGTAIDVLGRLVRILGKWSSRQDQPVLYENIRVRPIHPGDALVDALRPIARDGAALVEVQVRLFKTLGSLSRIAPQAFAQPAARLAEDALSRIEGQAMAPSDRDAILEAAKQADLGRADGPPPGPSVLI